MTERLRVLEQSIPPEAIDVGETFGRLAFSDFYKWTREGDIYERAIDNLSLQRMHGIRALSFLTYERFDPKCAVFSPYIHTRYKHSLEVSLVGGEMLKLNNFPKQDIIIQAIAGLIHDNATPAFGDAAKKVDPKALDEERHWWPSLDKKGQDFITKKLGIQRKTLDEIIKNRGIQGQVLDRADRIVYTMTDLNAIVPEKPVLSNTTYHSFGLYALHQIISHYPKIGNIYKEVRIDKNKEKVYFTDPKHLEIFLLLRAHLHEALYLKPENQGRDLFVAKVLKSLYSRTDPKAVLNPQKLRAMTDDDLLAILQKHYKPGTRFPQEIYRDLVEWNPKFEEFGKNHLERAKQFAEELKKKKNIALIGIHNCKGFDPATLYNVLDKNGSIIPFKEYDPNAALEIEVMAEETKRVYVFYSDISNESETTINLFNSVLK